MGTVSPALVEQALKALMPALYPAYPGQKIIAQSFNGEPANRSRVKEILTAAGFEEDYQRMILWPSARQWW